jgi:hypothetical protein
MSGLLSDHHPLSPFSFETASGDEVTTLEPFQVLINGGLPRIKGFE